MKSYDKIKDMLCDELDEIAKKNELTSSNLEVIDKAIDIIKDIHTIYAMESEYPEGGYSRDGGYSNGFYSRYPYYMYDGEDMGNSYARGRGANASRDSMGRYSQDGHMDDYSRDAASELHRLMENAKSDKEREALRQAISTMQRM